MEVETFPLVGRMLSPCLEDVVVQSRIGLSAGRDRQGGQTSQDDPCNVLMTDAEIRTWECLFVAQARGQSTRVVTQ